MQERRPVLASIARDDAIPTTGPIASTSPIAEATPTPTGRTGARRSLVLAGVAVAVVTVDQFTKSLALEHLRGRTVDLWWTLRLNLHFNEGGAFGFGQGLAPWFIAAGVVLLAALLVMSRRVTGPGMAVALGLVVGGAVGNLVDRLLRDHGGAVVDFIDLQWWPIFNVADMAITCGAALLLVSGRRRPGEE